MELVRRIYDAWNRGESTRGLIAEDVEYVNPPYAVESGVRIGRDAFGRIRDAIDDVRVEPHRFVEAGDDVVVVVGTLTGRSHEAGVPVEIEQGYVWTIHDGQAVRFRWFQSAAEALEAAGLG